MQILKKHWIKITITNAVYLALGFIALASNPLIWVLPVNETP